MRRSCYNLKKVTSLPKPLSQPKPYNGPSAAQVAEWRAKYQNPVHKSFYAQPVTIATGKNQYLWDTEGKQYLDMYGGVSSISVGHAHDDYVAAVQEQVARYAHSTPLYNEAANYEFMAELSKYLPQGKDWVFHFTNSGSEATEFATYLARAYTKNHHFVTIRTGYHGLTDGARSLVSSPNWRAPAVTPSLHTIRSMQPNAYRGLFGTDVDRYIEELQVAIDMECGQVAAFIAERISGVGGIYPLLDGYLPKAYDVIRNRGGLVISDEVQCGFGRLGKTFWGFELDGVVPDIITCAKSISNGMPLGLCITTREIAQSIAGPSFFNTFGGNPVVTAGATAALKVIKRDNLMAHNSKIGDQIIAGCKELQKKYPIIDDIRGMGIMIGLEFGTDVKNPMAVTDFNKIMEQMRERGILIGRGGRGNVMRLQGPYTLTEDDASYFLYSLEETLKELKF